MDELSVSGERVFGFERGFEFRQKEGGVERPRPVKYPQPVSPEAAKRREGGLAARIYAHPLVVPQFAHL
jgi:hypothetical protein